MQCWFDTIACALLEVKTIEGEISHSGTESDDTDLIFVEFQPKQFNFSQISAGTVQFQLDFVRNDPIPINFKRNGRFQLNFTRNGCFQKIPPVPASNIFSPKNYSINVTCRAWIQVIRVTTKSFTNKIAQLFFYRM